MHVTAETLPGPASQRAYLRGGLPAIYRDDADGFAMRFVGGLEEVLDPVVGVLDSLHAHFDVELAPPDLVVLVAAWVGLDLRATLAEDAADDDSARRALAREAVSLVRARGTREGLERLLNLAFPGLEITVRDTGRSTWSRLRRDAPAAAEPAFTVSTETSTLSHETRAALRRVIRRNAPAHVRGELRVGRSEEAQPL